MKKFFRSTISVLLAAFILASGGGIVIGKMICLHSGRVHYSFSEAKDCCGDDQQTTTIKGKCCALANIIIKSDNFVSQPRIDIPVTNPAIITPFVSYSFSSHHSASQIIPRGNAPPDLSCTARLSLLSSYRI